MSIVYVNDWNGYNGGIFDTFENAAEGMAILAVGKGVEGHEEAIEGIEYLTRPLADVGFGGTRHDRNLYLAFTAESEMFSIHTHDTATRPGHSSRSVVMFCDDMASPAWAVQKALFDFSTEDYLDGDEVRENLVSTLEDQILKIRNDTKSPAEALAIVRGSDLSNFATAVYAQLFECGPTDPAAILDSLPVRAGEVFDEIIAKAFPALSSDAVVTP
jgi:hypothetical protein